ncbi:MAG: inner membrane CreD family protein, partial [Terriglobales bacterium]
MDLNSPISVLILGFLVLVFGSILRRRATDQLQYWFFGWVLLLVHLLLGLISEKVGATAAYIFASLGTSAMILAALSFVLAVSSA